MSKIINLNKTIYELTSENPELIELLAAIGFTDITKPGMLNTAGRFMTLPKGAAMKKISLEHINETLIGRGYQVKG